MVKVSSYKDLIVWQKSMDFAERVYLVTTKFPQHEIYALSNQLRRAVVSVPSNVAEGSCRRSKAEFIRFINIASGSLAEVETQLLLAERLRYLDKSQLNELQAASGEIGKMLFSLQRSLTEKVAA